MFSLSWEFHLFKLGLRGCFSLTAGFAKQSQDLSGAGGAAHSQILADQFLLQATPVQTRCFEISPQAPAVQADYFQPAPCSHLGDLISPDKNCKTATVTTI